MPSLWFLLLAGCSHGGGWHVSIPQNLPTATTDSVVSFRVMNSTGGVKAGPVQKVEAHCTDASICEARGLPGEVQVIPNKPGSTTVIVDTETDQRERQTIALTVVPAKSHEPFGLGTPLPSGNDVVYRLGEANVAHCTPGSADVGGRERTDVHVLACTPYVDIGTERRFRIGAGDYVFCVQTKDRVVVGTATIENVGGRFEVKASEGSLDADVCTARN